jgi:hypothetical protein
MNEGGFLLLLYTTNPKRRKREKRERNKTKQNKTITK